MIKEEFKILLVEDDMNDAQLIEYHLHKLGENFQILKVETFEEFKKTLCGFAPDLIVSDYNLKDFNGMEVLQYTVENLPNANFIFLTGTINDEELAAQTILNGASGYVLKKHMNVLGDKLRPYLARIASKKRLEKISPKHKQILDSVHSFLESSQKENQAHLDSLNEIKRALKKYKSLKT